jgi:hypothetical protein
MTAFGAVLIHRATLVRHAALMQGSEPVLDEDGHVQFVESRTPAIPVAIQPLSTRERAAQHQAGATVSSHRIYAFATLRVSTADMFEHDPDACPMKPDLPATSYQINGVANAAGVGHHLEIDATEIGPANTKATSTGGGSGSGSGS